jgi:hypothetical protein
MIVPSAGLLFIVLTFFSLALRETNPKRSIPARDQPQTKYPCERHSEKEFILTEGDLFCSCFCRLEQLKCTYYYFLLFSLVTF